ncbi:zinc finger and BTB domain-containing protein 12-like [Parambassis ranga]|uniref:Zinc finger and BTB domain-containing protein 12-like n=1 Tax=Parambassis ranga TaxID=210632 RepID=A0A6P7JBS9_9TELE|nr:zinc finger and BTB domain-containing protein 12-like [Parambassis ranga]
MSVSSDTLQFSLPTHGDSVLSKMNILREEHRFCDITLIIRGAQSSGAQPLHFHGHQVVLAASSDFLRDQFLLHEGRAELSVGVVSSVKVAKALLLSCYTRHLEVPVRELVSYLTAASALQMNQVVEKCAQAVSQYLSPTLAFLKLDEHSEKKGTQQVDSRWPRSRFENQKEKDAALPSTSIQEANTKPVFVTATESKLRVSQEAEVDRQRLREMREGRKAVKSKTELSEDAACCLDNLESEEGDIHVHRSTLKCKLHPAAGSIQNLITSSASMIRSSAAHVVFMDSSENQHETEESREDENMNLQAASQAGDLIDSDIFCTHVSETADQVAKDSDRVLAQRPYLCRRCDKVFQHLESYVGHLKEHRQHFCLLCGKGFSQKSNLTHHIRFHTGIKPFRCPLCHKTFTQKAMLQDHLNLHTGGKPQKYILHKSSLRCHQGECQSKSSLQNVAEDSVVSE